MFKKNIKSFLKRTVGLILCFCMLFSTSTFAATDENNVGGGTGNPDGTATAGKASYTALSQMWKISVYVAKKDTVTHSSEYLNLTYSITNGALSDSSACKKITVYGLPLGSWTVTENRPARYGETYVGYVGGGQTESLSFTATVTENATASIRFDNFLQTYSLSIVKRIKAEDIVWAHGNPTFFFRVNSMILVYVPGSMGTSGTTKQVTENQKKIS